MRTRYIHRPTAIVPAASRDAINAYFTRQNLGPIFSIPLVIGPTTDLVKDSEPRITHYGTSLSLTDAWSGILDRQLAAHGGQRVDKVWEQALNDLSAKRDTETHPFQLIIVVTAGQRAAIITRLTTQYPDAGARFFKTGLSATGAEPITRYADWLYASNAFKPLLDLVINQLPRTEVFIGCRDGRIDAVKALYGDPKYQNPNPATRAFARVWINHQWQKLDVLKTLGLTVIP